MNAVMEPVKKAFCSKSFEETEDGEDVTGLVSFEYGNGKTVEFNVFELPMRSQRRLTVHGAIQKGGDTNASFSKGFQYSEAISRLEAVVEALQNGSWRVEGDAKPRLGELAAAIARIKSVVIERARAAVDAATDEQRQQWRSNSKVKEAIAQIRAEAASVAALAAGDQELSITL